MFIIHSSVQSCYRADIFCLKEGERINLPIVGSAIIFVRKGELTPFFDDFHQNYLREGDMFFLPQGVNSAIESFTPETEILFLQIPNISLLCHKFFPDILFKKECLPGTYSRSLKLKGFLFDWVDSVLGYISDSKTDDLIIEIKTLELFHFIKSTYSEDCISDFFSSVDENDYKFVLFILRNYTLVRTVEELACLSVYSLSGFEKQFRRIFKMAPYQWMLKQKSESIYKEIHETSKPLKLIAEEFGFSGLSEMGNFCRRHLGFSPRHMRTKKM